MEAHRQGLLPATFFAPGVRLELTTNGLTEGSVDSADSEDPPENQP